MTQYPAADLAAFKTPSTARFKRTPDNSSVISNVVSTSPVDDIADQEWLNAHAKFDWLSTSVSPHVSVAVLKKLLKPAFAFCGEPDVSRTPDGRYHCEMRVRSGHKPTRGKLRLKWGGPSGTLNGCFIEASGPVASMVADLLWDARVEHLPSRLHVCIDWSGSYDDARVHFVDRCTQAGMDILPFEHLVGPARGKRKRPKPRSINAGSTQSAVRLSLYEKGLKLGDKFPADMQRIEIRVQVDAALKKQFSTMSAAEVFATSLVARDLAAAFLDRSVEPYVFDPLPEQHDPEHLEKHMVLSYGNKVLAPLIAEFGPCEAGHRIALALQKHLH